MARHIGTLANVGVFRGETLPAQIMSRKSYSQVWEEQYADSEQTTLEHRYVRTLVMVAKVNTLATVNGSGIDTLNAAKTIVDPACVHENDTEFGVSSYFDVYPGTWRIEGVTCDDSDSGQTEVTISMKLTGEWEAIV